jgi:outer membrane receptor protein involved in Fe transport
MEKTDGSELSATRDRTVTLESFMLGNIRELNTGAYVNQSIRFNDRFSLNAGLRYDHFNMRYNDMLNGDSLSQKNTGIFSPKLNFYYHANDKTEFYITTGRGFHSNDTRVSVRDLDRRPLPAATGVDLGANFKPLPNLWMNAAFWYLSLQQEFVYVGDEGVVEPSGRSRRLGLDLSARYQLLRNLFVDLDANYCYGRSTDEAKGADYLPLAPVLTSIGGLTYKSATGLNGSLRYRFMSNRPANETSSVTAKGYFVTDALINYTKPKYEFGIAVQNLFNVRWKETQFDTESRLKGELLPVSEIHFTPGTPFFLKASVAYFF